MDIFDTAAKLIRIEKEKGIGFTPEGWPRFESWMFQKEIPESILPYSHRREALLKEKTSICFYEHDKYLYPFVNMSKLEALASELHKYNSFIGFDLSVFYDMLYPLQKFYILMNLLVDIYLALSGNRLIPNCRADQTGGQSYYAIFKDAPIVCIGTLGCVKNKTARRESIRSIFTIKEKLPNSAIIQYGPPLPKDLGISKIFKDYMTSKKGEKK